MYDTTPDEPRTTEADPTDDVVLDADPVTVDAPAISAVPTDEQKSAPVPTGQSGNRAMFERALENALAFGNTKRADDLEEILRKL